MKRTLHLVYPMPYRPTPLQWAGNLPAKVGARLGFQPFAPWRTGRLQYDRRRPPASPVSITIYLVKHFQQSYRVRLYDWMEEGGSIDYGPDDIIIGHLAPKPGTVMSRFLNDERTAAAKILLQPFAHGIMDDVRFLLPYLPLADAFAAICGPFWMDSVKQSEFAPYLAKMQRIDMAIDAHCYPHSKTAFNSVGKRRFLYIGHSQKAAKGCSYLSDLAASMPDVHFGWIGDGKDIPNVHHVSGHRDLSAAYMQEICSNYDFMITMGVSDANPTTILEAMSWGLPVLCTPQSGYYNSDSVFSLSLSDTAANIRLIRSLQQMPSKDLEERSSLNRQTVATAYTWATFCASVDSVIARAIVR